ncbi:hypothetical protein SAMN04487967_3355 [Natronorubrum sediminis]|uniref:CARDB protein n=1 Tax=Natronorubrum sediminis TaxID=640943 RepID=A0A1H6G3P9_9EURY|nr:hypothetical protein [Natronorubrum sediminis]SEH17711.1 hypothetical protein SAMN04487967_3355 [Natronorubrum sediminis]
MTTRGAVFVFVVLLCASLPAGVVGAGEFSSASATDADTSDPAFAAEVTDGTSAMADEDDVMEQRTELTHIPDDSDVFGVETTFEPPEGVHGFEVGLESDAELEALDGFEEGSDGTYRWDETTAEPSIEYAMPADRTDDGHHHDHADGGYSFVDTGEWGLVQVPDVSYSLQVPESEAVGVEETVSIDGDGTAGSDVAFFGSLEEYERTVDGETITLAVPDAADMTEEPGDVLDTLETASGDLELGPRSDETLIVAAPTDADWGPRGVQYGDSDAWVRADAELEEASNVWLHEYVHVRQGYDTSATTSDAEWLVEAQAEYYAASLALEQGLISFDEFADFLERGEQPPYADETLAEPTTWDESETDYVKGPLVYGEIDRQLRVATDGDRTLEDVFRQTNAQHAEISQEAFRSALEDAGGEDVRAVAEAYTQTAETPKMWSEGAHTDAFEQPRSSVETTLDAPSIDVAGEEWEYWESDEIDGLETDGDGVLAVPEGETVTVPVDVENTDEQAGTAGVTLEVGTELVDGEQRALKDGETATETLSWEPGEPGVTDVRVGDERLTVFVRSSPSLSVEDLEVEPSSVDAGESATAVATVEAAGDLPAAGTLSFRTADGIVDGAPVALAPGETATTEVELTFDEETRYEVAAGEQTATVTVGGTVAQLESIPGFGVVAGLLAISVALRIGLLGRRR